MNGTLYHLQASLTTKVSLPTTRIKVFHSTLCLGLLYQQLRVVPALRQFHLQELGLKMVQSSQRNLRREVGLAQLAPSIGPFHQLSLSPLHRAVNLMLLPLNYNIPAHHCQEVKMANLEK